MTIKWNLMLKLPLSPHFYLFPQKHELTCLMLPSSLVGILMLWSRVHTSKLKKRLQNKQNAKERKSLIIVDSVDGCKFTFRAFDFPFLPVIFM